LFSLASQKKAIEREKKNEKRESKLTDNYTHTHSSIIFLLSANRIYYKYSLACVRLSKPFFFQNNILLHVLLLFFSPPELIIESS
jgi:hypothetical protein